MFHSTEDEHFKYIFLGSSPDSVGEIQLQWMEYQLVTSKHVPLFIHHPVLQAPTVVDFKYPLLNRWAVKEVLIRSGREITMLVRFSAGY